MSRLFHYTTWQGKAVAAEGVLRPDDKYLPGGPPLVWLTENDEWEPSIQARNIEGVYERGPSNVVDYLELGIPCWRFEVEVKKPYKLHYHTPGWIAMLKDGIELGSDISQWHWVTHAVKIDKAYRLERI